MPATKHNEDLDLVVKEEILNFLNQEKENDFFYFVKYFGNAKTGARIVISEIDSTGLEMTYVEKSVDSGLIEKHCRIQWNRAIATKSDAEVQWNALYKEAKSVLEMKVDKTYVAPGSNVAPELFENPSIEEYVFVIGFWIVIFILSQPSLLPQRAFVMMDTLLGNYDTFYNILFAMGCINSLLSLMVLYTCSSAEFPFIISLKWAGLTLFFGLMTAGPALKTAYKRKFQLEAADDIG